MLQCQFSIRRGKKIQIFSNQFLKVSMNCFTVSSLDLTSTFPRYIPWNVHVPAEDTYNFKGIGDVYRYMKIAWSLGITVIVRPGPFLATEWDYGGFPAWLLKDRPTLE